VVVWQSVTGSHPLGTPTSSINSYPHTARPSPEEAIELDDDMGSLKSFGSVCSTMSCDHAYFGCNGTTFSGRSMKYVVHCSPQMDGTEEYLTPTQRANRQIRRLKVMNHRYFLVLTTELTVSFTKVHLDWCNEVKIIFL
jgi:hypothetical protein